MPIEWRAVGRPHAASRIAVHYSGTLFALNDDKALSLNESEGDDTAWKAIDVSIPGVTGIGKLPPDVTSIAAAAAGLYYVAGMDRSLWALNIARFANSPGRIDRIHGAAEISATEDSTLDFAHVWALNDDRSLWHNTQSGFQVGWRRVGQPFLAKKIATSRRAVYLLDISGTLWRSASGGDLTWEPLNLGQPLFDTLEITAATPEGHSEDLLYALNRDRTLWRGRIV